MLGQLGERDIVLKTNSTEEEYLEFTERITKTHSGQEGQQSRSFRSKAFAIQVNNLKSIKILNMIIILSLQDSTRCPVSLFMVYRSVRPSKMNE